MDEETKQYIDERFNLLEAMLIQRFDLIEANLGHRTCVSTSSHYPVCTIQEKLTMLVDLTVKH